VEEGDKEDASAAGEGFEESEDGIARDAREIEIRDEVRVFAEAREGARGRVGRCSDEFSVEVKRAMVSHERDCSTWERDGTTGPEGRYSCPVPSPGRQNVGGHTWGRGGRRTDKTYTSHIYTYVYYLSRQGVQDFSGHCGVSGR